MNLRFEIKKILRKNGKYTSEENIDQFIEIAKNSDVSNEEIIFIIQSLMKSEDSFFVGTNHTTH